MVKMQKRTRCKGVVAVEAAFVFPLLLLLTLGVIEYGWLFLKMQEITNAARHGARQAIRPDAIGAVVETEVAEVMVDAGMPDHTITFSTDDLPSVPVGEAVTVTVMVEAEKIAIIKSPFLPLPAELQASVTMAKEGF